ncbi:tyrosine-type recombinase/integrase [Pirellulaceae bacterium SH467]
MARQKTSLPSMRFHISGQAVVTIDRKDYYLGKSGSPESLARYAVLIAEYQANGLRLPDGFDIRAVDEKSRLLLASADESVHCENEPLTIRHVTAAYRTFVRKKYAHARGEIARIVGVCDDLDTHYGNLKVEQFGPKALKDQRGRWVADENKTRGYINRLTNEVCRLFKWGVSEEMVTESAWSRLKSVEPLRYGDGKENPKRQPVDIEIVRKTAKELSPIIKSMLRVQLSTGMRPEEVCSMRPCDIDRSGETWFYRPAKHKNTHRGKTRAIPILGDAREAITDYLNRDAESYLFSPREADSWFRAKLSSERKGYGSYKPVKGTLKAGPKYTSQSYRQAIARAAQRAKVPCWVPYQIRHLNLTMVRQALGIEAAQALGGHARADMTEHYAAVSEVKAIEAAKAAPKL